MVQKIFNVYDCKAEHYNNPFFLRTRGEALRGFQEVCNDPQSQISKYPADFTLFEIGEYDQVTGKISLHVAPVSLGTGVEFKKASNSIPLSKAGA